MKDPTMDCRVAREMLIELLYGELDTAAGDQLQAHLDKCPGCAEQYEQMSAVLNLVRANQLEEPQEATTKRILNAAEVAARNRADRKKSLVWWRWLVTNPALSGALVLVFAATVAIFTVFPDHESTEEKPNIETVLPLAPASQDLKKNKAFPTQTVSSHSIKKPAGRKSLLQRRELSSIKDENPSPTELRASKKATRHKAQSLKKKPAPNMRKTTLKRKTRKKSLADFSRGGMDRLAENENSEDDTKLFTGGMGRKATGGSISSRVSDSDKPSAKAENSLDMTRSENLTGSAGYEPGPEREMPAPAAKHRTTEVQQVPEQQLEEKTDKTTRRRTSFASNNKKDLESNPYLKAKSIFKSGDCNAAILAIDKAVKMYPHHPMAAGALFDKASCLVKLGRFRQATETYKSIERQYPDRAREAKRQIQRINP